MRARWHWLIPATVIVGLLTPILFTDRSFATDWGNHMWLIWVQGLSLAELGEPSYYLQSNLGAFYPYFAFYGGTAYALLGVVSQIANPEAAVLVAYAGALSAAYLSWTWLAMQAGVRGWRVQLPGCIAVTAPYAVSNLYGRGDIPETIATAMIPLAAASALAIVREARVRLPAAVTFVLAIVFLTGTHTLTLVWGATFLLLVAAIFVACNWQAVRSTARRGLTVAGLALLGLGLNAWIVVPLVLFHDRLLEGDPDPIGYTAYTEPEHLFSPLRNSGDIYSFVTGDVNTQLPVLALVWVLACGALCWRYLPRQAKRLGLGLLGLFGAFLLLIMVPSLIEALPRALQFIQFPYRLLTYADLCLVGLVTIALAGLQRAGSAARVPVALLAVVAALSFGQAMVQNFEVRSWLGSRTEALASSTQTPPSWYAPLHFADASAPVVEPTLSDPLVVPVEGPEHDRYTATYPPGPGGTVASNVLTGTYFVDVSGARPVGRTPEGGMVMRLPASPRPRQVTVSASWGTGVRLGRWLTLLSFAAALAAFVAYVARRG